MASPPPSRLPRCHAASPPNCKRRRRSSPRQTRAHHQRHHVPTAPGPRDALAFLDQHQRRNLGQTRCRYPEYYDLVDRTPVPFSRVLENLLWCCQTRPTVIQSLFMRVHGVPPALDEITAYAERLAHIVAQQGTIKLIQLYTVARSTTEPYATALTQQELENIQKHVHNQLPTTTIEVYP